MKYEERGMPKISIVTVNFNLWRSNPPQLAAGKFIDYLYSKEKLKAYIISQRYKELEYIIIIGGGLMDDTLKIVQKYCGVH